MKTTFIILALICSFPFVNINAQDRSKQIDDLIQAYNSFQQFSGNVLVIKDGKIIFKKEYGYADMEFNIPNNSDTKFRIGSLTKQFTAMLIIQLKQDGKLKLTDPISTFLPFYRKDIGERVTIHQLLTNSSGIPDYVQRDDFFSDISIHQYSSRQEFVKKFCSGDLQFEPGSKYNYSNSGFYILGTIIEMITKQPYATVLKEKIFDVVGMKNSGMDIPEVLLKDRARGYNCNYGTYTNADYINSSSSIFSAGGIYSTTEDLMLWNEALYGEKLLSQENKKIMFTPALNKYACGIIVNKILVPGMNHEVTFATHTGGINGFRALILRNIEDKESIILLSNVVLNNNPGIDLNPIGNRIFSILHGIPYEMPKLSAANAIGEKIDKESIHKALSFFQQIKIQEKDQYDFSNLETELNSLGYTLLNKNRIKEALAIFKLNTQESPNAWNVYDSYGEALMADGQKAEAIKNYEYSLKLNPENTNAEKQLKILKRK